MTTLNAPATGAIIQATDVSNIANVWNGVSGYSAPLVLDQENSTSYNVTLKNSNANERALRIKDASNADIMLVNNDGVTLSKLVFTPVARSISAETSILSAGSATYTSSAGITTQRFYRIQQPTIAFTSAQTVTTASTLTIDDAPAAGSNATITNAYALNVAAGKTNLVGAVSMGSTLAVTGAVTLSSTLATGNLTVTGTGSISSTLSVGGTLTVTTGGVTVTGNSTITGTLGGLTGLTVSSGGATITGNSTITGTLGGLTGLTVSSGGATITGNSTITGTLGGLTGLTVASGGATISGTTAVTGALSATGAVTFNSTTVGTTVLTVGNAATTYTTNMFDITCGGITGAQVLRVLINANQVFAIDGNGVVAMGNASVTPSRLLSLTASGLGTDMINATVGGAVKFNVGTEGQVSIAKTTDQLILGTTRTLTITAPTPATSSRTLTLPDPGGNDSVAYLALAQTLTNKTLTSPKIGTSELDTNGNVMWGWSPVASAVNYITVSNQTAAAATTTGVGLIAGGSSTNISFHITPAGTGTLFLGLSGNAVQLTGTTGSLGFFGMTPTTRTTAYTQTYSTADRTHAALTSTDLSGITSSTTGSALAEPSAAYTQAEQQQNFRRIQDQFNNLKADLTDLKQLVNSVIDDLQGYGLFQ